MERKRKWGRSKRPSIARKVVGGGRGIGEDWQKNTEGGEGGKRGGECRGKKELRRKERRVQI